jgi:hypothetical protein
MLSENDKEIRSRFAFQLPHSSAYSENSKSK